VNLRVLDGCAATSCQNAIDSSTSTTTAEVLTVRNTDPANPKTYTVVVGSSAATTAGTFTILATRQLYAITTPAASCQIMTGATPIMGGTATLAAGDSVATANLALPFAFSYFATPVTTYSVTSNGLFGLFATTGTVSAFSTLSGNPIPNVATPNNVIAAYAADMDRAGAVAGTAVIQTLTVGTTPNRTFVVEWFDFAPWGSPARPERLQFQVKLQETTNAIELHYCRLDPSTGLSSAVTGGNAVIGLENAGGTDPSVAWSYQTANSVNTTQAIVFTPVP
jgi:hypothetical protein